MPEGQVPEQRAFVMELRELSSDGHGEGYLSLFGEEDAYGDIVEKGAFKKTLKDKRRGGSKRPFLWQHDDHEQIGILEGREDDQGLLITWDYNLEVQRAKEAYALAKAGIAAGVPPGLSQGFDIIEAKPRKEAPHGRHLKELVLWEGSQVTFPALLDARVGTVRMDRPCHTRDLSMLPKTAVRRRVDPALVVKSLDKRLGIPKPRA